jgi:transmembrane sensor
MMMEHDCWKLLENEAFVRWVLNPDEAGDRYWETWMEKDHQRILLVEQAKEVLHHLQRIPPSSNKELISNEIWENIQRELNTAQSFSVPSGEHPRRWWAVAATVVIIVLASAAGKWYYGRDRHTIPKDAITVSQEGGNTIIQCRNQSVRPQKIYLVDGSVVTLEPQSALSYTRFLGKKIREVTLDGNAFFEIAGDPNRPFLVRSGDIVTRVLGTSFRINADPDRGDIHVAVRTGKVSVYKKRDFDDGHEVFCVLLPRQEAVFYKKDQNLAFVQNADVRLLTPPVVDSGSLSFDDVPVITILDRLQSMYHIRISYNRDSLQQCRLTTSLQEERLADKLSIICKAINAGYHIEEDAVVIDGGHCQ